MSVWCEEQDVGQDCLPSEKFGASRRRPTRAVGAIVIAVVALLAGLVTPVAAAVPDEPTGLTASAITATSASLDWVAPASPITGYRLEFAPALAVAPANPAAADVSAAITGLAAGETYTVSLYALDGTDESLVPATTTINTPAVAPAAPGAPTLALSGTDALTISWAAVTNTGGSPITEYEYLVSPGGGWTSAGTSLTATTAALTPDTYTAQVRATNAVDTSPASAASNSVEIAVPATAPGVPTNFGATASGSDSVDLDWTAPADDGGAAITGYQVKVDNGSFGALITGTSTTISGLAVGNHTFFVRAVNSVGPGDDAVSNVVTILPPAPDAVPSVNAAVNADNTQVTVTWGEPASSGGIVNYVVSISPAGSADSQSVPFGDAQTATFSGLPAGTYTVSVIAVNAGGNSTAGTDTFDIVVAPGSPLNVKTSESEGVRVATVTWDPPANNGNGTISGYVISMGGQTKTVGPTIRTVTFTDLPIGTLTATVQARNAQGLSAAGSSPEFESKRPVHPFESREAFVQQAFRDLFDRAATAAEQTQWVAQTEADGANGPEVLTSMMRSDLFETRRQVSRLYFAYFLRVPDAAGQNYWVDLMDRGQLDLQGVSDEFARSAEFIQTYGNLDDAEFVVVVYNNVLLRTPDIEGFNYWLRLRQEGLSRGGVMTWFTEGEEFKALSLSAIDTSLAHITMLDRSPTESEYRLWVNKINNGDSLTGLLRTIWNSDEYAARVTPG